MLRQSEEEQKEIFVTFFFFTVLLDLPPVTENADFVYRPFLHIAER